MDFPNLDKLLFGLQKEGQYEYIKTNEVPVISKSHGKNIRSTNKILGGNLAINLQKKKLLAPFFSETLVINDEIFLGRGEDTLFGPIVNNMGGRCVDIDLLVFHDCFGNYPKKPDISEKRNVDRFYYACVGWLIRNPFFNWIRNEYYKEYQDPKEIQDRYEALVIGSKSTAEYFNDDRFLILPEAFKASYEKLDKTIYKYHKLIASWNKFKTLL